MSLYEGATSLARTGHAIHVLLPARGELLSLFDGTPVSVSVVPFSPWTHYGEFRHPVYRGSERLLKSPAAVRRVHRVIQDVKPDLVVTNTMTIVAGALAARIAQTPHVWYVHEFGKEDHNLVFDYGDAVSYRLMDWLSDAVIVNSQAVRRKFAKHLSPRKLHVVYYAVKASPSARPANHRGGPLRLCLLGQISPGKRQDDAIRAMGLLRQHGLDVYLRLVGPAYTSYGSHLRSSISELGLEDRVVIAEFTRDPFGELESCDVVLMCSSSEAFGRVTVEAMKAGRAVVGANGGATPELIRDGWNGLLYRANDPTDLASKVETLYHNRGLLHTMALNGQEWATATFSMENYAAVLINIFNGAVRPMRGGAK